MKKTFWELELASIITSAITLLIYFAFIVIVHQHMFLLFIYSMSIIACVFDISWFFSGIENFRILMIRNFVIKTVSVILILTLVKQSSDLWIYVLIQSGSVLLSNISLWPVGLRIFGKPQITNVSNVLLRVRHSIRFFIPQASINVYVTLNKVVLGFISTKTQTGYFDTSDKLLRMVFTLFIATSTVVLPRMSNLFAHKNYHAIKQFVKGMLGISFWAIVLVAFLIISNAELVVRIVLGRRYLAMIPVLQIAGFMLIPMAVSNVLANQYLVPLNRITAYTKSVVIGAIFNVLIEIPLILMEEAKGAAFASIFSEIVVAAIQLFYCRKDFQFVRYVRRNALIITMGLILLMCGIFVAVLVRSMLSTFIISVVFSLLYIGFSYKWVVKTFQRMFI